MGQSTKVYEKRNIQLREKKAAEAGKVAKEGAPIQFSDVEMVAAEGNPYHKPGEEFTCSEAAAKSIESKGWATRKAGGSPKVKAKELAKEKV